MKQYRLNDKACDQEYVKRFILDELKNIKKKGSRYYDIIRLIDKGYVLDYGCGCGCFSKIISEKGNKVLAIDLEEESIKIAKEMIKEDENLKFSNEKISNLKDEIFDTVVSTQVLEHVHNPGNYLMECNRVLKKDGCLIISVPNIINFNFFISQLAINKKKFINLNKKDYIKANDHIQAWDPATFCRLMNSMGFEYVDHKMSEGMPFFKYYIRRINIPIFNKLSYTMIFKFKKVNHVKINNYD